jgi:hypothetical protein
MNIQDSIQKYVYCVYLKTIKLSVFVLVYNFYVLSLIGNVIQNSSFKELGYQTVKFG